MTPTDMYFPTGTAFTETLLDIQHIQGLNWFKLGVNLGISVLKLHPQQWSV